MSTAAYIWRETAISVAINAALSLVFFALVFGFGHDVAVWGLGQFVFDLAPQGFMIGLMATLVPGKLALRNVARGKIKPICTDKQVQGVVPRALYAGAGAASGGTALGAALALVTGVPALSWQVAVAIKLAFGCALAAWLTPVGLRKSLSVTGTTA